MKKVFRILVMKNSKFCQRTTETKPRLSLLTEVRFRRCHMTSAKLSGKLHWAHQTTVPFVLPSARFVHISDPCHGDFDSLNTEGGFLIQVYYMRNWVI